MTKWTLPLCLILCSGFAYSQTVDDRMKELSKRVKELKKEREVEDRLAKFKSEISSQPTQPVSRFPRPTHAAKPAELMEVK